MIEFYWEVVKEFTQDELRSLIQFITGHGNIPTSKEFQISISESQYDNLESLPSSSTCNNALFLPPYENKIDLAKKLCLAINLALTIENN